LLRLCLLVYCALLSGCAPPPEREIVVAMTEYGFLPPLIEVTTAERIRIVVRNIGRLEHDLVPDARGKALGLAQVHLQPGGSASNDWTAPSEPTELRITCTVLGHESLGMVARLVVRPRASPAPTSP
jgi:uncharacterized cupredoxin-like copper-binding protein